MSILRYTGFISLSRAGNCDVNSEMIAEVRKFLGGHHYNKDFRALDNTVA